LILGIFPLGVTTNALQISRPVLLPPVLSQELRKHDLQDVRLQPLVRYGRRSIEPVARQCRIPSSILSAVSQNQPLKVEIKGFKTSHFLEQKTAPWNSPDAGPMEHVELPKS
jgi:hypothetical protein